MLLVTFSQAPNFLSFSNVENVLRQMPVLLMAALGQTVVILIGSIDLSVPGIINLSAGTAAVLIQNYGEVALLAAVPVGIIAGLINGLLVIRFRLPSFLVTLGTLFVFNGVANLIMGGVPRPYVGPISRVIVSGTILDSISIVTITAISVWVVAVTVATRTRHGRYLIAMGGSEEMARLSGVRVARYRLIAFAASGFFAGLAGLFLLVRAQAATPMMGDPFLLTSIAAVVVGGTSLSGGVGGPHWTLLGALIIILLDNGMTIAGLNPNYQIVIRGLVIIVAAAFTLRQAGLVK